MPCHILRTDDSDNKGSDACREAQGVLKHSAQDRIAAPALNSRSLRRTHIDVARLSVADISTAVPVCNSLTFVFTAVTAMCLGEKTERPLRTLVGMTLVVVGIAICMASKATRTIQNQLHEDSELD